MSGGSTVPTADRTAAGRDGRPAFHLTAERGWINDPHGIVHREDGYHVFTQWVPDDVVWQVGIHWGHAVGPDLLSLRDTGTVAIAPGDGDDGIWTGCLVEDGDRTLVFYTSVTGPDLGRARIRVAEAEDRALTRWRKGPVVVEAPADATAFRDPVVTRRDGTWWMTVGAELPGRAAALAWTSDDLEHWTPAGTVAERSSSATEPWTGTLWECPQVIAVGPDRDVVITSVWAADVSYDTAWAVGRWSGGAFHADAWSELSHGGVHYAPSVFRDADGCPAVLFWIRGITDPGGRVTGAVRWAGALSVPYRIVSTADGARLELHPDVHRHEGAPVPDGAVGGASTARWTGPVGDVLRIDTGDGVVLVRRATDAVVIGSPDRDDVTVPLGAGPVDVVVDGAVVEVLTDRGLGGTVLAHPAVTTTWSAPDADRTLTVRALVP